MIEAVVQVGAEATPYLRCGRGARVVVVLAPAAGRLHLVRALAPCCRVVAPVLPRDWRSGIRSPGAWLGGAVDGLGLEAPVVLLAPALAAWAGALAAAQRFTAVLVLRGDEDAATLAELVLGAGSGAEAAGGGP